MQTADIEVLRELYMNDKVDFYRFHQLYSVSPGQLARTVTYLQGLKVVEIADGFVKLTDFGRKWIIANRKSIFLQDRVQEWKDIPKGMQTERIPLNSFYKPNKSLLDREFFGHLMEEKGVDNMH